MFEITPFYHLPNNTYWSCSSTYNGLSNKDKQRTTTNRVGQSITLHSIRDMMRIKS